jgi:hypothetical protein
MRTTGLPDADKYPKGAILARLVTSFSTTEKDVDCFCVAAGAN